MKTCIRLLLSFLCTLLCSWGYNGYNIITFVAGHHLSEHAKKSCIVFLGLKEGNLPDFEHDVFSDPLCDSTQELHDMHVPPGLDYGAFSHFVKHDKVQICIVPC